MWLPAANIKCEVNFCTLHWPSYVMQATASIKECDADLIV